MTNFNRTSWFKKFVMFMKYIIMAQIASCIILICKSWHYSSYKIFSDYDICLLIGKLCEINSIYYPLNMITKCWS